VAESARAPAQRIRLLVQTTSKHYGDHPAIGFVVDSGNAVVRRDSVVVPGPPLVLTRGVPVEITVVNHLDEPTSIHWHGIELDSYFDGVSGWSGTQGSLAPHIAPSDSFVVRFTPPRAGTFIYHTHFAEQHQLSSGMYGAMVVLEPGVRHDPATDRLLIFGQAGPGRAMDTEMLLNGERRPSFDFKVGVPYRLRVININPNVPLVVSLRADSMPARWRALAKDGADLPTRMVTMRPASVRIGVGEAYDYEFIPERAGDLMLRAVDPEERVKVSGVVRVR
jgi:FtsP/CotA-like multicopper oxidase with cupredoxin domain